MHNKLSGGASLSQLQGQVIQCIQAALVSGSVDVDLLTNSLYAQAGRKFLFLFNQNLRRTNVQIAELMALLQVHVSTEDNSFGQVKMDFTTFDYIKVFLGDLVQDLDANNEKQVGAIAGIVAECISNKVLFEACYGSVSVFLPPHLSINAELVCAESGYIHSCGHLLLLRNATKAKVSEIRAAVEEAVSYRPIDEKFLLVPYCHEDFSPHDRAKTVFLDLGLDEVKLNLSKAYVGDQHLGDVLEDVSNSSSDKVFLPPGGNYEAALETFESRWPGKSPNTIWIMADAGIVEGSRFPSDRKFYAMYLQLYRNHNRYHLFDENKPGWASHTTLPHSLAGAMINLARPWLSPGEVKIADPFGGSGTTFFEAQKFDNFRSITSDIARIYRYVLEDNVRFFSLSYADIDKLIRELTRFTNVSVVGPPVKPKAQRKDDPALVLQKVWSIVSRWLEVAGTDFLDLEEDSLAEGFSEIGPALSSRIILYTALRASVRGYSEILRGSAEWMTFFQRELKSIITTTENYRKYLRGNSIRESDNPRISIRAAAYSPATLPVEPNVPSDDMFNPYGFEIEDVRRLPNGAYDLIVTDPPYGFNTDEQRIEFGEFMAEVVPLLVGALKPSGGQLILACPEVSFSGRSVLPFVRSDFLTREVMRAATKLGRECVVPAMGLPNNIAGFRPPYYWVAEKTLRRRILHFWIRPTA